MDLLTAYKHYLFTTKSKTSSVTVKNYLADVSRFLRWYEEIYKLPFNPQTIPPDIIQLYKSTSVAQSESNQTITRSSLPLLSERSFARHIASLRKFFAFLRESYGSTTDPFAKDSTPTQLTDDDRWYIRGYKDHLYRGNASHHTIKNYIADVKHFLSWLETVSALPASEQASASNLFDQITTESLREYRSRLVNEAKFASLSVNRKLSSIRSYTHWLQTEGILRKETSIDLRNVKNNKEEEKEMDILLSLQDNLDTEYVQQSDNLNANTYSSFPPIRLVQKLVRGLSWLGGLFFISPLALLAEKIQLFLFKVTGKSIFTSLHKAPTASLENGTTTLLDTAIVNGMATGAATVSVAEAVPVVKNLTKSFYAPLSVATQGMPFLKRITHILRYYRPQWYIRYHSYSFVHYVHFGVLLFCATALTFGGYYIAVHSSDYQLPILAASEADPPKLLSFSGKLTTEENRPITATSILRFSLYNSEKASGSALLWQEVRNVRPDGAGHFSLTLGQKVPIPANLLSQNPNLFIGVTLGNTAEMRPREQIATAALAKSAQSVGGMKPITQTNDTANTLLALDSAGNLSIGGAGPTFQATEGLFTLSGEALLLTTNIGSDANITLAPDGQGAIDVQSALVNTTERNNLSTALGAVEVDDNFAILASSSAVAALTIQQDGFGPLISASSSGAARFSLDTFGNGFFAGDLALEGSNLTTKNTSFNILPENAFNVTIGNSATALSLGATAGNTTIRNNFIVNGNTTLGDSTGDTIVLNGRLVPAGNQVQDIGSSSAAFNNAFLTNVFLTPSATMSGFLRRDNGNISLSNTGDSLLIGGSNPSSALIKLSAASGQSSFINSGKLGIGTTASLTDQLHVYGDIRVGTTGTDGCLKRYDGTAIAGTCSSDRRFKKNIAPITDVLGKLDQLQPVTYEMRTDEFPQYGFGSGTAYGLIAQDVEQVFPQLVETDANGYKMVKYGPELTMISLQGIRELSLKVNKINSMLAMTGQNYPLSPEGDVLFGQKLDGEYTGKTADGTLLTATGAYFKIFAANISAGVIKAKQGVFDTLAIATENITIAGMDFKSYIRTIIRDEQQGYLAKGTINSPSIGTNIISPLADDSEITIDLRNSQFAIRTNHSASGSAVATIDKAGNASFSGQLTADSLHTNEATISGTLRAGRILAADIVGLDDKLATLAAQQNASSSANQSITNVYNIYTIASTSANLAKNITPTSGPVSNGESSSMNQVASRSANTDLASIHDSNYMIHATDYADIASFSASLAYVPNLNTDFATVSQGLMVFGAASMADVSVAGQLAIGGKLILADNTINVLGQTLEIQPLRQGNIALMGGLIAINTNGDVQFGGNATFAKNVTINGELAANFIAPIPGKDLVVKLGHEAKIDSSNDGSLPIHPPAGGSNFKVQNSSGSAVLSINALGDVIASGAATLGSLNIVRGVSADTSAMDTVASGSAGVATITAGYTSRTIYSPYVTKDSLIYVSPRSKTTLAVPYLARQTDADPVTGTKASFTVQIPGVVSQEVSFNWWIIN
jgi:site-specific recombinase XerD